MIVNTYEIEGNKLSLTLIGKEKVVGTYYIDTYQELIYLKENIKYGVNLKLEGDLKEPSSNTIPKNFNYKKYLNDQNIFYILDISKIEILNNGVSFIYKIRNVVNDRIIKIDNTGYMKAFILGDKNLIDSDIYASYQKIGITHLFALSGMHVGLLNLLLSKILVKLKDKNKYLIIDAFLIFYGFIVGFPSSIKRCILFFIINNLNKILKLDISSFKILLIVIIILIFYEYQIIFDIGFIYSICTVGGIIFCNNFITHDKKIITNFRLSLVAFLFSFPISLYNFYEVNLLSIVYNMFFIPLISLLIYPLSLISFFVPFFYIIFVLFIKFLEISGSYLSKINLFNMYLDFDILQVLLFYIFICLFFFYYKKIYLFFVLVLVILDMFLSYCNKWEIYFFEKTTTNMIQKISSMFAVNPLFSKGI